MALKLSTGMVNAQAGSVATVVAAMSGNDSTLTLVDGGGSADTLTDSGSGLVTAGFEPGDYLSIFNATTGANDGNYKLTAVAAGTLTVATGSWNTGEALPASGIICSARGHSVSDLFRNGVLEVYTGSQPADSDTAESGTKALRITDASGAFTPGSATNGLRFDAVAAGVLSKTTSQVWSGVGLINPSGTAGYFRFYDNSYTTGASTTAVRFDGACGTSGQQLNMSTLTITYSATTTIDSFNYTIPQSA